MLAEIRAHLRGVKVVVVTGAAGVGKSQALSRIARHAAVAYVRHEDAEAPLPIVVPLQQVKLSAAVVARIKDESAIETREEALLRAILEQWARWANQHLAYPDAVRTDWVLEQLERRRTVLIFDALDEFMYTHPGLRIADFKEMVRFISMRCREDNAVYVVIGTRLGLSGYERLSDSIGGVFHLGRMTEDQMQRTFPHLSEVIKTIRARGRSHVLDLLLTPFVLSRLAKGSTRTFTNSAALLREVLASLLVETERQLHTDREILVDALACIAQLIYRQFDSQIDLHTVTAGAAELRGMLRRAGNEPERLSRALQVLGDERCVHALMGTIFLATGRHTWRLEHDAWFEYLMAQYLEICASLEVVEAFRDFAFTQAMFRMAASIMGEWRPRHTLVEQLVTLTAGRSNDYIIGNFFALLSQNPHASMDERSVQLLLQTLESRTPMLQCVLLNGFCHRVLVDAPTDRLRTRLRQELVVTLDQQLQGPGDTVTKSLVWCYLRAFERKFGLRVLGAEGHKWPDITGNPEALDAAAPEICPPVGASELEYRRYVSLQEALVGLIHLAERVTMPPVIAAVHYLFYLVVAWHKRAWTDAVGDLLAEVFSQGSLIEQAIVGYAEVPEVGRLFTHCRSIYRASH